MFERYTEKARRSIFFARYEASNFGSQQIGTEHLLLGLVREDRLLLEPDAPLESIRKWIETNAGPVGEKIATSVDLPLSEECKRALYAGYEEAKNFGHVHIAPGHLVLGLMDQKGCVAAAALREYGYSADTFREVVAAWAGESSGATRSLLGATNPLGVARAHWGAVMVLFSPANARARQIYFLAQGEARKMGSPCLETKHLLLALIQSKNVLGKGEEGPFFGVSRAALRERIKPEPPRREKVSAGTCVPTDELRNALTYARGRLGHKELGPEHLVLGLLREEASEASEILRTSGLSLDQARRAIAALRNPGYESEGSSYV
jgi:ATP-dependent Clp protease ATP-binding subunit ClpA